MSNHCIGSVLPMNNHVYPVITGERHYYCIGYAPYEIIMECPGHLESFIEHMFAASINGESK